MIMLEALIIYPVTMFLLFFILAVFSVLYQRWNLQTVANEATMRMAQTYRLSMADDTTGYVKEEDYVEIGAYRYAANVFTKNMEESIEQRIKEYSLDRLSKTTYTKSVEEPDCDVVVVSDALGRRHLETTIKGSYSVPLGQMLTYFGFDSTITYEVHAYAECLDIIDYINIVDYTDSMADLGSVDSLGIIGLIDSLFGLIDSIFTNG